MPLSSSTATQPARKARSPIRRVVILALTFLLLAISLRSTAVRGIPVNDFLAYWAAARLEISGQNPYSQQAMYELQKQHGLESEKPLMMWAPPWLLPFIAPIGLLSLQTGRVLAFATTFILLIACADWLWQYYGGDPARRWLAWVLACTFVPAMVSLASGQISPLVLLGLVTFLWFQQRGKVFAAGTAMLLIAFKPHLLYLVWIVLVLEAVQAFAGRRPEGRWTNSSRVLCGALVSLAAATALALALNPAILTQYSAAWKSESVLVLYAPAAGGLLRVTFGWQKYWLQFLPVAPAVVWAGWRQGKHSGFDWRRDLPLLLTVSVCTSPYGWLFDQVVVLPAVLQRAVEFDSASTRASDRKRLRLWLSLYVAANLGIVILLIMRAGMLWLAYAWTAPVWLLLYVGSGTRRLKNIKGV